MPNERKLKLGSTDIPHKLALSLDLFLTAQEAQRSTDHTISNYRLVLTNFMTWLTLKPKLDNPQSITSHHIRQFLAEITTYGISSWYIHAHARALRTFFRFLHDEEVITTNPMARVAMPRLDKKLLPAYSQEDMQKLLSACKDGEAPERDAAIVLFLLDSGVRAQELVNLTIADVDMKTGMVMVKQGKGRKDRVTRIGGRARKALLKYYMIRGETQTTDPLFLSLTTGQALSPNGLLLLCRRLGERADVHCYPHRFRRTCALWLHRSGARVTEIAQLLGHSSLEALSRYLDMQSQDAENAHRAHSPADNMSNKKGAKS